MSEFKMFEKDEKVSVYIEGYSFFLLTRVLRMKTDFSRFMDFMRDRCKVSNARAYFSSHPEKESSQHRLADWMRYNGFLVHIEREPDNISNVSYLTAPAMTADIVANHDDVDHIVLFGGFRPIEHALKKAREDGISVTLVGLSTDNKNVDPNNRFRTWNSLRHHCDQFIELDTIMKHFGIKDEAEVD